MEFAGFAVGPIIWDLFWRGKWHKIGGIGGSWCQVLEGVCEGLGVIEEIKNPLWWRELEGVDGDIVFSARCV